MPDAPHILSCPICGGDREADLSDVKALMQQHGLTGELVNPGGRLLHFGKKHLQVSDMCNSCDRQAILAFLATT